MTKKLLVVDDNQQSLYLLQVILTRNGFEVETAANGAEALEMARRAPPEMIISDILMPVMDGFALCRAWKADERLKDIPFVFYTATYTDPRDEELALSLGAARFVVKPQDQAAFVTLVRQVIKERKTGRPFESGQPAPEETDYYRLYSKALVRKLEDKMLALEEINRALGQEITERKRAEEAIRESEERFRTIFERSTVGKSLTAPDGKFLQINKAFADMVGYTIEEIQQINFEQITHPDNVAESQECVRILLAGEQTVYRFEKRYIHKSGDIVWVDLSTTLLRNGRRTPLYLISSIVDITERKQAEEQLQHTLKSLRNAVSATVQVMTSTVEARDPYTAGHQVRSADLARAIATEMELPQEKIDAIRMAGTIHDIGKIAIPAEILSKPTKLTEIEFSLVKEHSQRGYEILKDVESPWRLAEIAYQHHERMDGTGYPRNLKGEDILIEARILAVADTVEAMSSYRPYRPGLGISAALKEIEKNKRILYDADAVDACLRLFREKRYELPQR